jgi:hypothetical protein
MGTSSGGGPISDHLGCLRRLHPLVAQPLQRHSLRDIFPQFLLPLAAAVALEREEMRSCVRARGDEKKAVYIFLTKSRSRFHFDLRDADLGAMSASV